MQATKYRSNYTGKVVEITHILYEGQQKGYRCQVVDPGKSHAKPGDRFVLKEKDLFSHAWSEDF